MMFLIQDPIMQLKLLPMEKEDLHLDGSQVNMEIEILAHGNGAEQWFSMN